ncbi:MAG: GerMN domain-containing protein [Pseudomonadota bacterium]
MPAPIASPTPFSADATTTVTVYLPRGDLTALAPTDVKVPKERSPLGTWVASLVEALSVPAGPDTVPIFPAGTRPRTAFLGEDGTVYVDLPSASLQSSTAGIQLEMLAVEGFAKTILSNVENSRRLKILADGTDREAFWGHVYVRRPIEIR